MFPLLHMSQTRHCRDHHLDEQAHNRKVQIKVYYPYEKSPHKIKKQPIKKAHTNKPKKKIRENPILFKKKHTQKTTKQQQQHIQTNKQNRAI